MQVECREGHKWWATPNKLIHQGTWCPHCHSNKLSKRIELHANRLKTHIDSKGGKLLSQYKNTRTKVQVKCREGHKWWVTPDNLIKKGAWCPQCHLKDLSKSRKSYGNRFKQLVESKGGKLLSEYKNAHAKVQIECERGHKWRARPNDIINGTWCKKCYYIEFRKSSRKEVEEIIKGKDGKLLEIDFSKRRTKVHVECKEGHRWWARKSNIKEGKWCKQCYLNKMEEQRGKKIDELKALIDSKGGKLLSEYVNVKTKVHVECKQVHKWWVSPDNLINGGTWCPQCQYKTKTKNNREHYANRLKQLIKSKGGKLLSEYKNAKTKAHVECNMGHRWWTAPSNLINRGTWCPLCHYKNKTKNNRDYYGNRLKELIQSKGGKLLSEYKTSQTKVQVECKRGHKWWATPHNLIYGETWCPHCHYKNKTKNNRDYYGNRLKEFIQSKGGKLLSEYKNAQTKVQVECNRRHKWWTTPNNLIHRERWCPQCNFKNSTRSKEFYANRIKKLIESKGGKLLSEYKNAETKVQVECKRGHKWWTTPNNLKYGKRWCPQCHFKKKTKNRDYYANRLKQLIQSKGGKLLSEYKNAQTKVQVECKKGHKWRTTPHNLIHRERWCPQCRLRKKTKSRDYYANRLKQLIESKGGKLLSEYINSETKVQVECKKGHKWWTIPNSLIHGERWCRQCHFEKLSDLFTEYTISDLREFAESKGGACLEEKYLGWGVKHEWQCSRGHTWKATPRNIFGRPSKKGTWCPFCAEGEIFERVCRGILEEMFQTEFPKSSPQWLNIDKIGKPGGRRHLDGLGRKVRIAFERQGIQHYRYEPFFHKGDINNFLKQKEEDEFKRKRCKENNVILLEIGFIKEGEKLRKLKFSEIEDYLRQELLKKGVKVPERKKKINWVKFISIHRKQDLILKLLMLKGNLSQAEIAARLKFSNKSVMIHTRALKALHLIKSKKGKQNRVIYYLNKAQKEMILEQIGNIPDDEINSQLKKIRPIENRILELLQKRSHLTIKQISETLKYSTRTIGKYLKSLKVSGYIAFKREVGKARSHPKLWYIRSSEWNVGKEDNKAKLKTKRKASKKM